LIGRLIKLIKNTETIAQDQQWRAAIRKNRPKGRSGLQRRLGTQILSTGVFTHLIDAASSLKQ